MAAVHWTVWRVVLLVVAAAPLVYYVVANIAAWRFFRRGGRRVGADFTPPVSLLKPVRGVDFGSYENFASFCRQDYPNYEILFAVNDFADPAVPVIQRLITEFPERQIRLFVGADRLGANRKVNKLARLAREARHEILAITDGDVRVGGDYLRKVVAPLADDRAGAVTSFYRGIAEKNLYAELEAIGASSDFFAGVLVAQWMEGMFFALGASIVTTKRWVDQIGGFQAIANVHSDDYELGYRIRQAGGKIVLSHESVWTMYPAQSLGGFWRHQVRWARTVRLCRPLSFAGLLFTHGLPWAVLAALISPTTWLAATYLCAYLLLRLAEAGVVGIWGVGDDVLRHKLWMLPLRDAVYFFVWIASFASNRISWGDEEYTMHGGQMVRVESAESRAASQTPP
jgi:ceramide glucosyltransferase